MDIKKVKTKKPGLPILAHTDPPTWWIQGNLLTSTRNDLVVWDLVLGAPKSLHQSEENSLNTFFVQIVF